MALRTDSPPRSGEYIHRERVLKPVRDLDGLTRHDWDNLTATQLRDAIFVLQHSLALAERGYRIRIVQSGG